MQRVKLKGMQPTVYFFAGVHCPIARQYAGRMAMLGKRLKERGVRCILVDANADERQVEFDRWARECQLTMERRLDPGGALARQLGASVTPEAVLVDSAGVVRYLGRIDDSLAERTVVRQDLWLAVQAVLDGREVSRPRIPSVGCRISLAAPRPAPGRRVTYHRDVRPILERHCIACHRPGEAAPFSLMRYPLAREWATPIRRFTMNRQMPPWKADPGHGAFFDARWLSPQELAVLAAWEAAGAPEGRPQPHRSLPMAGTWPLGRPDEVVAPSRPYTLAAEGEDVYRHFLLSVDTSRERFIRAFDFQPGNRRIVHHVLLYVVTDRDILGKDGADGQPGWPATGSPLAQEGAAMVAGWAPGATARRLPEGVGFRLPRASRLVAEVHYHKSGRIETDRTRIALYFASTPTRHALHTYAVGEESFVLKPDVADQRVTAELPIPADITLWTIFPHMHQLGKTMRVWARRPDGKEMRLIRVQDWEFKWQGFYHYRQPVFLPRGSVIYLEASYDNTRDNPNQPSLPPREVRYGEQTTDEMCYAFFNFSLGRAK